jgi:hypothetical protein
MSIGHSGCNWLFNSTSHSALKQPDMNIISQHILMIVFTEYDMGATNPRQFSQPTWSQNHHHHCVMVYSNVIQGSPILLSDFRFLSTSTFDKGGHQREKLSGYVGEMANHECMWV